MGVAMTSRLDSGGSAFGTFLFGAVLGAGVALLFAPMSGKETRRRLAQFDPDTLTGRINDAASSVSGIVNKGVDAYKKAAAETEA
jgi:gas vesicle protein